MSAIMHAGTINKLILIDCSATFMAYYIIRVYSFRGRFHQLDAYPFPFLNSIMIFSFINASLGVGSPNYDPSPPLSRTPWIKLYLASTIENSTSE